MAFTFINYSTNYNASFSTGLSINKPTNTTNGDIMFLHLVSSYGVSSATASGWTKIAEQPTYGYTSIWYKIASSEGVSYTINRGQNIKGVGTITTYRGGFDPADPIDVFSNTAYRTDNNICRTSLTITSANSPILFFGFNGLDITFTAPTVPENIRTERYEVKDFVGFCGCGNDMIWSSSGATGNIDATLSGTGIEKHAFGIALNPAPEVFGTAPALQRTRYRDALGAVGQTFALGATYGYFAGGDNGGAQSTWITTDRIVFSTSVTSANTVSNLSTGKYFHASISDKSLYGYFVAGSDSNNSLGTTDRITFSTGATAANTISNITTPRNLLAGLSDGNTYGYASGGTSGADTKITHRLIFSTGATATNTASDLSGVRTGLSGISSGSTYGYFLGGYSGAYVSIADKITFSSSITAANTVSNLSSARSYSTGLSDGSIYGYYSAGGFAITALTDRIVFSTGVTSANTVSNISTPKYMLSSNSDGLTNGYFSGGNTGAVVKTTDRIVFSTGVTSTNTVSNISTDRYGLSGLSDLAI